MKWNLPGSRRTQVLGLGALVTTAALAVGGVVVANGAGATTTTTTAAPTYRTQLIEMLTAGNKGYFYTASQAEYISAQKLKFKFTGQVPGYVSSKAIRGTVPLYRMRNLSRSTYLLTLSATERNKLAASGQWRYEGVVGRVPVAPAAGRVQVFRVSKNGAGWRVVRAASVKSFVRAGWRLDGPLGYLWTSK